MTYSDRENKKRVVKFLSSTYGKTDFLINKEDIFSSIIMESVRTVGSRLLYLSSVILFKGQLLPLFDIDNWLKQTFGIEKKEKSYLTLILRTELFSSENREYLKRFYWENGVTARFSKKYVALNISGDTVISGLDLNEMRLLPFSLIRRELDNGILGVKFLPGDRVQYLINIEEILFGKLIKERVSSSSDN